MATRIYFLSARMTRQEAREVVREDGRLSLFTLPSPLWDDQDDRRVKRARAGEEEEEEEVAEAHCVGAGEKEGKEEEEREEPRVIRHSGSASRAGIQTIHLTRLWIVNEFQVPVKMAMDPLLRTEEGDVKKETAQRALRHHHHHLRREKKKQKSGRNDAMVAPKPTALYRLIWKGNRKSRRRMETVWDLETR